MIIFDQVKIMWCFFELDFNWYASVGEAVVNWQNVISFLI